MPGEMSIELSWEELKQVILSFGFVIVVRLPLPPCCLCHADLTFTREKKEERKECVYDDNAQSMLHTVYNCVQFSALKIDVTPGDSNKEA